MISSRLSFSILLIDREKNVTVLDKVQWAQLAWKSASLSLKFCLVCIGEQSVCTYRAPLSSRYWSWQLDSASRHSSTFFRLYVDCCQPDYPSANWYLFSVDHLTVYLCYLCYCYCYCHGCGCAFSLAASFLISYCQFVLFLLCALCCCSGHLLLKHSIPSYPFIQNTKFSNLKLLSAYS